MKCLTDRHEIAKAMNYGKYVVLTIDHETPVEGYEKYMSTFVKGSRVKVRRGGTGENADLTSHGCLYFEDGRLGIEGECFGIHSGFGYSDVMEMYREANTPTVSGGDIVIVVEQWGKHRNCIVRVMRVSKHVDIFCSTVAYLEDLDESETI